MPLRTEQLTSAEVLRFRDEAFDKYFTNSRYLDMVRAKFGPAVVAHLEDMTKIKLKRKILSENEFVAAVA
jgi:hypothetical protein